MAVKKEKLARESAAAHSRPIELITENDFSIIRMCDLVGTQPSMIDKYAFLVRDPHGNEVEITVEINPPAVEEISRRSRRRISSESSYWMSCAERHLTDYLWENNQFPPNARLMVKELTPDDCDLAIRWDCDP